MPDALTPVKERIIQNVVSTIEGISTAAGFPYTLTVERPNPASGNASKDNGVVVVQGNLIAVEDEANGFDEWHLPVSIVCTVFESESSTEPIDSRLNIIEADVVKEMTREGNHTRGGLAQNTWSMGAEQLETEYTANYGQIAVHFLIHFRHLLGDPYSQS